MDSVTESDSPLVGIVTLNWNSYEDTAKCLNSIRELGYNNYRVYVADNGSEDGSLEALKKEFDCCKFIENDENLGFAGGNNPAISEAFSDGSDYVLLLNNDAVVEPDLLGHLVETAEEHSNAAIVGGVALNSEGEVHSAGGKFSPVLTTLSHNTEPDDSVYETSFISGALMLLRREFITEVDGLNDDYFFGMEDAELCWQATQQGWNLLINPKARIYHDIGASAERGGPFRYYHDARNRLYFAHSNLTIPEQTVFFSFFFMSRLFRFIQWGATGNSNLIRAVVLGIFDFSRNADYRGVHDFKR